MNTNNKILTLTENYNVIDSPVHDTSKLQFMSDSAIRGAYLANILAALVLYRVGDRITKQILRDTNGRTLTKYSKTMSPLNFWGTVVHNSKQFKDVLSGDTVKSLETTSGRILKDHVKSIHTPLSLVQDLDWIDVMDAVRVITLRLPLRTVKVDKIRTGLTNWEVLDNDEKAQVISYAFYFLMENDQNSVFLTRLRAVINNTFLNFNKSDEKVTQVVKYVGDKAKTIATAASIVKMVKEEGEVVDIGADAAAGTSSADIATVPFKLFKNKVIKRVKRKFTRLKAHEKRRRNKSDK